MEKPITTLYSKYGTALRYLIVGGFTTGINVVLFFGLTHLARRVTAGGHGDFVHRPHLNARFAADCEAARPGRRHRAQLRLQQTNFRFERDELFVHAVPVNFDINGFLGPVIQSLGEASQHIHRPGDLNRPAVALMSFFFSWHK
ncbi:hypothetical protein [Lactiplantibacillus garii]|uniref:hypothetical protein n=1 Tax=Lactiplantibacillus garii TaxID=2306423 RepID=UPI001CDC878D